MIQASLLKPLSQVTKLCLSIVFSSLKKRQRDRHPQMHLLPPIKTLHTSVLGLLKPALLGLFADLFCLRPRLGLGAMRLGL